MNLQHLTTRFLQYNLWANERLTTWLVTLPRDTMYGSTGSSFGTIDRTLQHILSGELYWHHILVRGEIREFNQAERVGVVEDVIAELVANSKRLLRDLSAMSATQLMERIKASDSAQSRYEYILHVVNHGSYHRGQIVSMCRALGVKGEVPVTDYDGYLWWVENVGEVGAEV